MTLGMLFYQKASDNADIFIQFQYADIERLQQPFNQSDLALITCALHQLHVGDGADVYIFCFLYQRDGFDVSLFQINKNIGIK